MSRISAKSQALLHACAFIARQHPEKVTSRIVKTRKCWVWTGCKSAHGYAMFHPRAGMKVRVSRLMYLLHRKDPGKLQVLHKCDNPACVKPKHLFLGSIHENMIDSARKNRIAYGRNNGFYKFSATLIRRIKRAYSTGRYTGSQIADKFGVSKTYVYSLDKGRIRVRELNGGKSLNRRYPTVKEVRWIRKRYDKGASCAKMARKLGLSYGVVIRAALRMTYRNI